MSNDIYLLVIEDTAVIGNYETKLLTINVINIYK